MIEIDTEPAHLVGQTITLVGTARDAHLGAVVLLSDNTPVFIDGLPMWDDQWDGKRIRVTGLLKDDSIAPDPEVNQQGEVSHGMYGDAFVLVDASWEEAT